jgi:GT2 family glycosyltransferase
MKIGVGIITYNRPELLRKCFNSIPKDRVDEIVVVNDGVPLQFDISKGVVLDNPENIGVGKSKNRALRHLIDKGCEYIFLIEDDIFIIKDNVFDKYIEASKLTGIQHFNFSQHGVMNKAWPGGIPQPRVIIDYNKIKIPFYPHCVGAFSFYTKHCLNTVGLIDERYVNAFEHVDHTYEIIKAGMHPPFWYFADIEKSWEYLGDEEWSIEKSTISSKLNHKQMMHEASEIFVTKHHLSPMQIPVATTDHVVKNLKNIKQTFKHV